MMLMNASQKDIPLRKLGLMVRELFILNKVRDQNISIKISHAMILIKKSNALLFALAEIPMELLKKVIELSNYLNKFKMSIKFAII